MTVQMACSSCGKVHKVGPCGMSNSQPVPPRTPEGLTAEQVQAIKKNHATECRAWEAMPAMLASSNCATCGRSSTAHVVLKLLDEVDRLRAALAQRTEENDARTRFMENAGFRRCDIPACNCNGWHGGHANERLREISDSLADAGIPGGTTIHGGVLLLIQRAEQAEAELAQAREQRDAVLRDVAKRNPIVSSEFGQDCFYCGAREDSFMVAVVHKPDCFWLAASGRGSAPQGDT